MNYIKQLQAENENLKNEIAFLKEGIRSVKVYLHSSKFDSDISVNKNDILLRIAEIESGNEFSSYDNATYCAEMGFTEEEALDWKMRH